MRKGAGPFTPVNTNKNGPIPKPADMAAAYNPIICPRLFCGAIWLIQVSAETKIIASAAPKKNLSISQGRNPPTSAKQDNTEAIERVPKIIKLETPKRTKRAGVIEEANINPRNCTLTWAPIAALE